MPRHTKLFELLQQLRSRPRVHHTLLDDIEPDTSLVVGFEDTGENPCTLPDRPKKLENRSPISDDVRALDISSSGGITRSIPTTSPHERNGTLNADDPADSPYKPPGSEQGQSTERMGKVV